MSDKDRYPAPAKKPKKAKTAPIGRDPAFGRIKGRPSAYERATKFRKDKGETNGR